MKVSRFGQRMTTTSGIGRLMEEVIAMISKMNAVMSLAPGSVGAALTLDLIRSGDIMTLSRNVIKPFYEKKAHVALEQAFKELQGIHFLFTNLKERSFCGSGSWSFLSPAWSYISG